MSEQIACMLFSWVRKKSTSDTYILCSLQGPSGASGLWAPEAQMSPWGWRKDHQGGAYRVSFGILSPQEYQYIFSSFYLAASLFLIEHAVVAKRDWKWDLHLYYWARGTPHTCHSSTAQLDVLLLPYNVVLFHPKGESSSLCTTSFSFINVINNFPAR